jgi:hypothetical protein
MKILIIGKALSSGDASRPIKKALSVVIRIDDRISMHQAVLKQKEFILSADFYWKHPMK